MAYEKKDAGYPATVEKLFRGTNYCRRAIATIGGKAPSVRRSLLAHWSGKQNKIESLTG
jgi:hypothetical protein